MRRVVWALVMLAGALAVGAGATGAQEIPPDSVSTVFVSDSIPGFGAVGGVVADGLGFHLRGRLPQCRMAHFSGWKRRQVR